MDYMKAHRDHQGWVSVITVLLGTGMRIGECLGLRWDDLDFEKKIITVNHTIIPTMKTQGAAKNEANNAAPVAEVKEVIDFSKVEI
ncbi:MAG: tyrosine-type recombinase/integrase, partial [Dorea sp.]